MTNGYGVDFALVAIILFFAFFLALVIYLRREDRREGYPLEEDGSGRLRAAGGLLFTAPVKTFRMSDGGSVRAPSGRRDTRELAARRTSVTPGSPLVPTGNGMIDGIGPGAYAERARVPDKTFHGHDRIVPMRVASDFSVVKGEADPRGMPVYGTDGKVAGPVSEIWVDRAESMIRYLEVAVGERSVLLPMTMAKLNKSRRIVVVDAITAAQFADVPALANPDQVTLYEEERVCAYYGGGFLYAHPSRGEPLL
jgi:photosynthetic reaction center H subunit